MYLYANHQGCDGDRLYSDGSAMIFQNCNLLTQSTQFSLTDVEVLTATRNIKEVRAFRCGPSRGYQYIQTMQYTRVEVDFTLLTPSPWLENKMSPSQLREPLFHIPEEEIVLGPAQLLWDYLRRSHLAGFLLPLFRDIDSASFAIIVYAMCRLVVDAIQADDE